MMAGTFICPNCGKETQQGERNNRRYCPECVAKRKKEREKENLRTLLKEHVQRKRLFERGKEEPGKFAKERAERDAEIDARSREYIRKQCRFCKYQLREGSNNVYHCIGCDYIARTGHRSDKGNGPGDCRSFEPMTKETKEERIARSREAMLAVEANNAQNTGEKMRKVN